MIDAIEKEEKYEIAGYVVNDNTMVTDSRYPIIGSDDGLRKVLYEKLVTVQNPFAKMMSELPFKASLIAVNALIPCLYFEAEAGFAVV